MPPGPTPCGGLQWPQAAAGIATGLSTWGGRGFAGGYKLRRDFSHCMDLRTRTDESVCAGEVTPGATDSARVGVWARLTRPAQPPLSPGLLPPGCFPSTARSDDWHGTVFPIMDSVFL